MESQSIKFPVGWKNSILKSFLGFNGFGKYYAE